MDIPDDPSKPCLSCTKLWCQQQNLPRCAGASIGDANPDTATGKEGDIEARCFRASLRPWPHVRSRAELGLLAERDSPRDQLVVTLFLLTVFGLLLGAGIKGRMLKAGFDTTLPWANSRRWWEVRVSPPVPRVVHVSRPVWFLGICSPTAAGGYPAQRCGPLAQCCRQGPSGRLYQRIRLTAERVMCSVEDYVQGRTGRYRYNCIIFRATLAARCSNHGCRKMAPCVRLFRRSVLIPTLKHVYMYVLHD